MPDFNRTELRELAIQATDICAEELELYASGIESPTITPGMVRAVVHALEANYLISRKPGYRPKARLVVNAEPALSALREVESQLKALSPADGGKPPTPPTTEHGATIVGVEFTPFPTLVVSVPPVPVPEPTEPPTKVTVYSPDRPPGHRFHRPDTPATEVADPPTASQGGLAENDSHPARIDDGWNDAQRDLYSRFALFAKKLSRQGYMPTMVEFDRLKPADLPLAISLVQRLRCKWSDLAYRLNLQIQTKNNRPGLEADKRPAAPVVEAPAVPRLRGTATVNDSGLVESASAAPATILHRAPDGGMTRIVKNADGRETRMLASFEDKN